MFSNENWWEIPMYGNPVGAILQDECQPRIQVPLEMQEGQNFSSLFCWW